MRDRLSAFWARRIAPGEVFGLHLTLGMAALLVCGVIFGHLAADVASHARITVLDARIAHWLHAHAGPPWTGFMLAVTHAHSTPGLLMLAGALALYLLRRGWRAWAWTVVAAVPGGMILNVLLKLTFQRARPQFDEPLVTIATYSFPSGHALGATVLYGVLAAFLLAHLRQAWLRALALAGAVAMVLLVAFTRLYLGAHYLSDVLAGMVEGIAWLAVCLAAGATLRRHRRARRPTGQADIVEASIE
ncbi:MAG: phosphatase PAP2 family protein [Gammaproteobacteria bacterium]